MDLKLDPVELFPAIEHFLQTVPPNEWRARATNCIPCGDMPFTAVKVIVQHVVESPTVVYIAWCSSLIDQPIMVMTFMIFCLARSMTLPLPLSTHKNYPSTMHYHSKGPVIICNYFTQIVDTNDYPREIAYKL
jgi:hypothetical protein